MSETEYAKKVGLTSAAIRLQLKQGRLEGVQIGKQWRVKIVNDTAPKAVEAERLRAENEILKLKLSLISDILNKEGQ